MSESAADLRGADDAPMAIAEPASDIEADEADAGASVTSTPSGSPTRARSGRDGMIDRLRHLSVAPPPWADRALEAAIVATKAATLACAIDAVVNANASRFRGKGARTRAIGYAIGLALVPAVWRVLPDRGRYPRGLDLAVTMPLLIDAGGNSLGLYQDAHLDDVVHFLNAAIVAGVAGALFATRTEEPWEAALAGTGTAIAGETFWEIAEYLGLKAGAKGMDLTYDDTMADLAESALGAIVGGAVTWLRMPREKEARKRGWRVAVGGWRDTGEPVSLGVPPGSVADRVLRPAR